jgi:hypothetical protein
MTEDDHEGKKTPCPEDRIDALLLALAPHFSEGWLHDRQRLMYGVEGCEDMGLKNRSITTTAEPGAVIPDGMIYGVDLGQGDISVEYAVQFLEDGLYKVILIDPIHDYMRDLKAPTELMLKEPKRDHDRPWVAMKRKPWERKR